MLLPALLMSQTTTIAPRLANMRQISFPIPPAPPVTRMISPSMLFILYFNGIKDLNISLMLNITDQKRKITNAPAATKNDIIGFFWTEGNVEAIVLGTGTIEDGESSKSLKAATLSLSGTIIQINLPVQTFFVPAGTMIFAKYPSSGVSKIIVSSSVLILASKSPLFNLSPKEFIILLRIINETDKTYNKIIHILPSFLNQLTMVLVSTVDDNIGNCTFTWVG